MGEARRRSEQGLKPRSKKNLRSESHRIVSWFPVTQAQRDQFIQLSIRAGWIGIAALVILFTCDVPVFPAN